MRLQSSRARRARSAPSAGQSLEYLETDAAKIPWQDRGELGLFRAYCRTIWRSSRRHKLFAQALVHDVSYRDARRFQLITIGLVGLILLPIAVYCSLMFTPSGASWHEHVAQSLASVAAVMIWLLMATGIPSYFFHPRDLETRLQNRLIAMSYYTCAPLGLLWIPIFVWCIPVAFVNDVEAGIVLPIVGLSVVVMMFQVLSNTMVLAHLTMPGLFGRRVLMQFGIPLIWLLLPVWLLVMIMVAIYIGFTIAGNEGQLVWELLEIGNF